MILTVHIFVTGLEAQRKIELCAGSCLSGCRDVTNFGFFDVCDALGLTIVVHIVQ